MVEWEIFCEHLTKVLPGNIQSSNIIVNWDNEFSMTQILERAVYLVLEIFSDMFYE